MPSCPDVSEEPLGGTRLPVFWHGFGWAAMVVLTVAVVWLALTVFWMGPWGKDPYIYTDAAFLREYSRSVPFRYLHVYALAGTYACFGSMELGSGVWALAVFVGSMWITFLLGRRLAGPAAGLLGALLLLLAPVSGLYLTNPTVDMTALCLLGLALLLASSSDTRRLGLRWFGAGVLSVLAFRTKESSPLFGVALLWLCVESRSDGRTAARVAYGLCGGIVGWIAMMVADASLLGDFLFSIRPSTYAASAQFGFRELVDTSGDRNLVDLLCNRWQVPVSVLGVAAIACGAARGRTGVALLLWAGAALCGQAFLFSVARFGANERYLQPVVLPLLPIVSAWIVRELAGKPRAAAGRLWPLLLAGALGLGLAVAVAVKAPHFPKRAWAHLMPCVAVAAALSLAYMHFGSRPRKLLVLALLLYAGFTSAYVTLIHTYHRGRGTRAWAHMGRILKAASEPTVAIVGHTDWFTHARLRTHSDGRARIVARLEALPERPEAKFLLVLKSQAAPGYRAVAETHLWRLVERDEGRQE